MKLGVEGSKHKDAFAVPPENIYVPGLDKHPKTGKVEDVSPYQRHRLELPLNEAVISSMMVDGHLQIISVEKPDKFDNTFISVMDGVQRIRNGREANVRLVKKGLPPNLCMVYVETDVDEMRRFTMLTASNTLRTDASEHDNAEMAHWLMSSKHYDVADVARWFGKSPGTIKAWLTDRGFGEDIKAELAAGTLEKTAARTLAQMPPEKRAPVLAEAKKRATAKKGTRAGKISVRDIHAAAQKVSTGFTAPSKVDMVAVIRPDIPEAALQVLLWATGQAPMPDFLAPVEAGKKLCAASDDRLVDADFEETAPEGAPVVAAEPSGADAA